MRILHVFMTLAQTRSYGTCLQLVVCHQRMCSLLHMRWWHTVCSVHTDAV